MEKCGLKPTTSSATEVSVVAFMHCTNYEKVMAKLHTKLLRHLLETI